jgi:uncharacterized lipoprotein YddW (UPF0748 family)
VWLTKNEMLESREALLARLDRLRDAGFNSVYVDTQLRGYVMYPGSKILPQWEEMRRHDAEILSWLVPAIRERGMRAEAWTEYGFYAYWTRDAAVDPSRGPLLDQYPELTAVDSRGNLYLHNEQWGDYYSVCPANPKSHGVMIDLYLEMLDRFAFDGLNLDRIRFPTGDYCYCDYCRSAFEKDTGMALEAFSPGSEGAALFDRWRKKQTQAFVDRLAARVHEKFPGREITAAVVPPYMIDEKGQSWPGWLESGSLDAAMPMLYEKDISGMVEWIRENTEPGTPIYYGLDASKGAEVIAGQIRELREASAPGFTIWEAGSVDPLLPIFRETLFAVPAASPLGQPKAAEE